MHAMVIVEYDEVRKFGNELTAILRVRAELVLFIPSDNHTPQLTETTTNMIYSQFTLSTKTTLGTVNITCTHSFDLPSIEQKRLSIYFKRKEYHTMGDLVSSRKSSNVRKEIFIRISFKKIVLLS